MDSQQQIIERLNAVQAKLGRSKTGAVLRIDFRTATESIDDDWVKSLAAFDRLKELYLDSAAITDACVETILNLQSLTLLDVQNTSLSEKAIEQLSQLPELQMFLVRGTAVGAEFIAEMRKRLIKTRIIV